MVVNQATAKQIQDGFKKIVEDYPTAEQVAQRLTQALKDQSLYAQQFFMQKETLKHNAVRESLKKGPQS